MSELFYNIDLGENDKDFYLNRDESKHIIKSLRKQVGDSLIFTNGKGLKFTTCLKKFDGKTSKFQVLNIEKINCNENLHIGISILKSPTRFENFLEKVTEIGVNEITPIICQRTIKKNINYNRCERILISAMKQSFKFNLPVLNKIQKFEDFIAQRDEKIKLIATCDEYKKQELNNVYSNNTKNLIMIGPEGDFTEKEIKNSINNKFNLVSLGNSRLRAETAGIYACTAFSLIK